MRRVRQHGFDAVIPKPWQAQILIGAVARLLRIRANPDVLLIHLGLETQSHDYKETVDLKSKRGRASLAKDVISMANWGGGTIILGVAEPLPGNFVLKGVSESLLDSLETTRLNRAVNEFLDPPMAITVRRVWDAGFPAPHLARIQVFDSWIFSDVSLGLLPLCMDG